ncbi:hypothetical protein D9758_014126 [Tetrapyrgos nigripes]|uniref:Uncharacterized protein n=1 Tax=Tetrapyrgos nigripes TaxID=182062 RepID=A0A8H5CMD0_9AGAR|nr:hypothetical protein D9758_014126 [Tetrapyrgos nigripes]
MPLAPARVAMGIDSFDAPGQPFWVDLICGLFWAVVLGLNTKVFYQAGITRELRTVPGLTVLCIIVCALRKVFARNKTWYTRIGRGIRAAGMA